MQLNAVLCLCVCSTAHVMSCCCCASVLLCGPENMQLNAVLRLCVCSTAHVMSCCCCASVLLCGLENMQIVRCASFVCLLDRAHKELLLLRC